MSNKILVRGVNWIGDAVMTLPALRALREGYRDSEIDLMVKEWVAPVFGLNPSIDGIVEYRDKYAGAAGKIIASRDIRKKHYDSALLLQNAFGAAILAYLAGIPERTGYNRDARGFLLTGKVDFNTEVRGLHHVLYYLNLIRSMGIEAAYRHPWIYLSRNERVKAREKLKILKRPVILINPGATYGSAKRWPLDHFSRLISMIIRDLDGSVILSGSESEMDIAEGIEELSGGEDLSDGRIMNISGMTSLREFIAILSEADAVVTNDSGPMHLSYSVGTPVVSIFGSTDPELTGPPSFIRPESQSYGSEIEFGVRSSVLMSDMDCSPCFERVCPEGDAACLKGITPEDVFSELKRIIPLNRAIFFDRDGTLCHDANYLRRMEDFKVFNEVTLLNILKEKGYYLIGITNQSGIARGLVEKEFTEKVNGILTDDYGFDRFYYCPHHPDDNCACRKPSPGMAFKAREDLNIDLRSSFVVGDNDCDMELAKNIGAESLLVKTGKVSGSGFADREFENLKGVVEYLSGV